jgi:hypothetical protein
MSLTAFIVIPYLSARTLLTPDRLAPRPPALKISTALSAVIFVALVRRAAEVGLDVVVASARLRDGVAAGGESLRDSSLGSRYGARVIINDVLRLRLNIDLSSLLAKHPELLPLSAAAAAVDVKGPSSVQVFHEAISSASSSAMWRAALIEEIQVSTTKSFHALAPQTSRSQKGYCRTMPGPCSALNLEDRPTARS